MHCSLHAGQIACIAMPLIASNNTVKPNKAVEPAAFLACALRVNKCEVGSSFPDEHTFQPSQDTFQLSLFVFGWKKFPTNRWHPAVYLLANRALIFRILPLPFEPNSHPQTAPPRVPGTKIAPLTTIFWVPGTKFPSARAKIGCLARTGANANKCAA